MCFVVCCDYSCYVITITYLLSAVTDFLEYHLTEITEKLFSAKFILIVLFFSFSDSVILESLRIPPIYHVMFLFRTI